MGKRILILSTSPRRGGNSELLADAFLNGAVEAGHEVDKVSLSEKDIRFCRGCLSCQKTERCVIHDDMEVILDKMLAADVLVFATPIYFYEMSGQMKTLLDRTNPMFPATYSFRDIYLLATAADGDESSMDGAVKGLEGWISCFDKARLAGVVRGTGIDHLGAAQDHPDMLNVARQMGKGLS